MGMRRWGMEIVDEGGREQGRGEGEWVGVALEKGVG